MKSHFTPQYRDPLSTTASPPSTCPSGGDRSAPDLGLDVVASGFLLLGPVHGDGVTDDDRVGWVEQRVQTVRDLGKLHPSALEYLLQVAVAVDVFALTLVLRVGSGQAKSG